MEGRIVHTGIWKDPVPGRCRVGRLNLDGDRQGDLAGHGGEQRAAFVYQIDSLRDGGAGLVVLIVAGLLVAPVFHRVLRRFHLKWKDR